ncbi:pyrroloquinoline quinone precursor peptide PqqA [Caldovatus sediminis]|jgi:coenzyme PQQ precursor peptide PqqA|nr:pyrroloquinoline quinone precursor peptide PqqA [Caldovatus sediminis]
MGAAGSSCPAEGAEDIPMAWKKPRVTEVSLAMEINCYACAEA